MSVSLRDATPDDAEAIAAIYEYYVLNTTISFEEIAPDSAEIAARMTNLRALGMPYFVAEADGAVIGYAYASYYRARSAYRFTLENSVYVAHDRMRRGTGRMLMEKLIEICGGLGYRQMIAVISGMEDAASSVSFHASLGFRHTGHMSAIGLKFGRWLDVVEMQLTLGEGSDSIPRNEPDRI